MRDRTSQRRTRVRGRSRLGHRSIRCKYRGKHARISVGCTDESAPSLTHCEVETWARARRKIRNPARRAAPWLSTLRMYASGGRVIWESGRICVAVSYGFSPNSHRGTESRTSSVRHYGSPHRAVLREDGLTIVLTLIVFLVMGCVVYFTFHKVKRQKTAIAKLRAELSRCAEGEKAGRKRKTR